MCFFLKYMILSFSYVFIFFQLIILLTKEKKLNYKRNSITSFHHYYYYVFFFKKIKNKTNLENFFLWLLKSPFSPN